MSKEHSLKRALFRFVSRRIRTTYPTRSAIARMARWRVVSLFLFFLFYCYYCDVWISRGKNVGRSVSWNFNYSQLVQHGSYIYIYVLCLEVSCLDWKLLKVLRIYLISSEMFDSKLGIEPIGKKSEVKNIG